MIFCCRYGDKFAASPMARVLTVIWMLAGLIIQGLFVATVTMSLVSQSLDVDFKLYGNEVTRFTNSSCKGSQCVRGIRVFVAIVLPILLLIPCGLPM